MEYTLNNKQQEVVNNINTFLFNNDNEIVISGPAGSGKTYIINYIYNVIYPAYKKTCKSLNLPEYLNDIYITATTNKAVSVLRNNLNTYNCSTIYSLFKLVVDRFGNLKKTSAVFLKYKLIIIDECSMLDGEILEYIRECTYKCKFIFIGDKYQLPPVKGNNNAVFNNNTLYLDKIERSNNQDIIDLSNQLRDTIITGKFNNIKLSQNIQYFDKNQLEEFIKQNKNDFNAIKIAAYTNKKCLEYIDYIHDLNNIKYFDFDHQEEIVFNTFYKEDFTHIHTDAIGNVVKQLDSEEQVCTIYFKNKTYNIKYFPILVKHYLYNNPIKVNMCINVLEYQNIRRLLLKEYKLANNYTYKNKIQKLIHILSDYSFVDIRSTYSCTIHKLQGSSIDTVIIDLNDLSTCKNPEMVARLLYVAVSRSRNKIILTGQLDSKYGEIIK